MDRALGRPGGEAIHDHLFKKAFSRKEVMLDFLETRLPEAIFSTIDQNSLRLTNKSFVSKATLRGESDLIFEANIENELGYIYLICEHQSEVDQTMPFRFLEYNVLLMRQHLSEGHKTLPLILNICLYNENQDYNGPTHLLAMCSNPELVQKYMFQEFQLVNLYAEPEELLLQHKKAAFVELVLKQGIYNQFVEWLKKNEVIFIEFLKKNYIPYDEDLIYYILSRDKDEQVAEKIASINLKLKEIVMSAAERLRQEGELRGRQKGRQEGELRGRQKGRQEARQEGEISKAIAIAKSMLNNGEPIEKIISYTGLTKQKIKIIKNYVLSLN